MLIGVESWSSMTIANKDASHFRWRKPERWSHFHPRQHTKSLPWFMVKGFLLRAGTGRIIRDLKCQRRSSMVFDRHYLPAIQFTHLKGSKNEKSKVYLEFSDFK